MRMKKRKSEQSRVWGTVTVGRSEGILDGAVVALGQQSDDEKLRKKRRKRRSQKEFKLPMHIPIMAPLASIFRFRSEEQSPLLDCKSPPRPGTELCTGAPLTPKTANPPHPSHPRPANVEGCSMTSLPNHFVHGQHSNTHLNLT